MEAGVDVDDLTGGGATEVRQQPQGAAGDAFHRGVFLHGAKGASLGDPGKPGLYEPIHGSAPDIAGQGWANPLAAILSFEMALRWSLGRVELADKLMAAVKAALADGARTRDIGGTLSTTQMGDEVLKRL